MRLVRLVLDNICQHAHLDWTFKPGIIGIYGHNGAGKTNALIAAYAALTGDFSRHPQNQAGMVRQGIADDEPCRIQLWVEHGGDQIHVTVDLARELSTGKKRGSKTTLRVNNEKPVTKATLVRAQLDRILGSHRRLLDQFVFVSSDGLLGILSQDSEQRAKSLAHLAGTFVAEQAYNLLAEQIKADEPLAMAVEDNSDEIRQRIGEAQARREQLGKDLREARSQLLDKETRNAYRQQLRLHKRLPQLRANGRAQKAEVERLKQAGRKALREHKAAAAEVDQLEVRYDSMRDKADEWRSQRKNLVELKQKLQLQATNQANLADAQSRLAALVPPQPPEDEFALEQLDEQIAALKDSINHFEQLCGDLTGQPQCPTCGTPISQLADKLQDAQNQLPKLRDDVLKLQRDRTRLREQFDQYQRQERKYEQDKAKAEQDAALARKALDTLGELPTKLPSVKSLDEKLAKYEALGHELKLARTHLRRQETALTRARTEYRTAQQLLSATAQELRKLKHELDRDASVKDMRTALRNHRKRLQELAGIKARREELARTITREEEALARLQGRLQRVAAARAWVETMRTVREELMHRNQLPRDVHVEIIKQLVPGINERLSNFALGYRVEAYEDLSFVAFFMDGRTVPAQVLSKGEKVGLALNFRLEINTLFARQLGMLLVLDEPTDGFDEANRQVTARLLGELGEQLASRGQQLIVVTHDPDLQGCFQQLIRLGNAT